MFATQALFSVQVLALGITNREVNTTAGEVLFLKTEVAASSALLLLAIWPPKNANKQRSLCFEPAFFLVYTKKHKPPSESHSNYVPQA